MTVSPVSVSCLCGATRQQISLQRSPSTPVNPSISSFPQAQAWLCHCRLCRKSSGLLFTSYIACEKPSIGVQSCIGYELGLQEGGTREIRWFCGTCGCHVFVEWPGALDSNEDGDMGGLNRWDVCTGTLEMGGEDLVQWTGHEYLATTGDGGAAVWLKEIGGMEVGAFGRGAPDYHTPDGSARYVFQEIALTRKTNVLSTKGIEKDILKASCHCGAVQFHITRPDESSRLPHSGYPDLMIPYHTRDAKLQNPEREKWWLREGSQGKRYLAGTCACRSCRLVSGFEVQAWAFVPRSNMFFSIPGSKGGIVSLDFEDEGIKMVLRSFKSSEGVVREFCGRCGATVFWHDRWRPDLIDVSVGLLDSNVGARAEDWLDWWSERVSFEEDAVGSGRMLIESLKKGIGEWGGKEGQD